VPFAFRVQVGYSLEEFSQDYSYVGFLDRTQFVNTIPDRTSAHKLHDNEQLGPLDKRLIELSDMAVIALRQTLNLLLYGLDGLVLLYFKNEAYSFQVYHFYSHNLSRFL